MKLLKVGFVGSIVAAVCCFTPLLVWSFGAIGLASLVVYLDRVLLPLLALFLLIFIVGLVRFFVDKNSIE